MQQSDPLNHAKAIRLFELSDDAKLGFWTHGDAIRRMGWGRYDAWLSHEPELVAQGIWQAINAFPTYQRTAATGRPPVDEHIVLYALVMKQFLGGSYRWIESQLRLLHRAGIVPATLDEATFRKRNTRTRWTHLLKRFFAWILGRLPSGDVVVATDATGYSGRGERWRHTEHEFRAAAHWVKDHNAVAVPTQLYLAGVQTPGRVHDSKCFEAVWARLPQHLRPIRSLGDKAYAGQHCAEVARAHGAAPIHHVKVNARWRRKPSNDYEAMVRFQRQFPNRARALRAPRANVEATYSTTKRRLGASVRCRNPRAQKNEIIAKKIGHNLRRLMQLQATRPEAAS